VLPSIVPLWVVSLVPALDPDEVPDIPVVVPDVPDELCAKLTEVIARPILSASVKPTDK
jgi:hypothetical protein